MRDKLKNEEYWNARIIQTENLRAIRYEKIRTGLIAPDRINIVKRDMVYSYLRTILEKYSAEYLVQELNNDLIKAIDLTYESWVDNAWKIKTGNPTGSIILDQYTLSAYDQMVWMLSLGYLLDISNNDFQKLVDVIDRDNVRDFLFEFIIRAKIKNRKPIIEESYQEFFYIPQIFEKLRQTITETDKAETLVKEFITKEWYSGHKDCGWYDSHKNSNNTYFGYWSFETAAVVKIMGLDDSSFRDCQYYPKDLVHLNSME